ncbi:MAG: hypothetical protein GXY83_00500 [Rhodopirellula sp.]|nr:hypothetical protein [Rhodopirellula sp.]
MSDMSREMPCQFCGQRAAAVFVRLVDQARIPVCRECRGDCQRRPSVYQAALSFTLADDESR